MRNKIILIICFFCCILLSGCKKICPCTYGHDETSQVWIDGFPYDVTTNNCEVRPNICPDSLKSIWN